MFTYCYCGPVFSFEVCVKNRWEATTCAPTAAKARSNLTYRYKKEHGLAPSSKITLPGELSQVEDKTPGRGFTYSRN